MINISYDLENFIISAEGHAEYSAPGSDIVCAGISALLQSLAVYLTSKKEFFEVESQIETFGGFMVIKCCPKKKHKNEVRAVYELCVSGLSCIAKQYPRNAEVKFKGRGALSKVGG